MLVQNMCNLLTGQDKAWQAFCNIMACHHWLLAVICQGGHTVCMHEVFSRALQLQHTSSMSQDRDLHPGQ